MNPVDNKSAVITGASSGIGLRLANDPVRMANRCDRPQIRRRRKVAI